MSADDANYLNILARLNEMKGEIRSDIKDLDDSIRRIEREGIGDMFERMRKYWTIDPTN